VEQSDPPSLKKSGCLRRLFLAGLVAGVPVLLFHQWILLALAGWAAPLAGGAFGFPVQARFGGSIWGGLTVHDLELESAPARWLSVSAESVAAGYRLGALARGDFAGAARSVEVRGLRATVDLGLPPKKDGKKPKPDPDKRKPPPLILPDDLLLEGVSVTVILAGGALLEVTGLSLKLGASGPGYLRLASATLTPPEAGSPSFAIGPWDAGLSRVDRQIRVTDLALAGDFVLQELLLALDGWERDDWSLSLSAASDEAKLQARASATGVFAPPLRVKTDVSAANLAHTHLRALPVPIPAGLVVESATVDVTGDMSLTAPVSGTAGVSLSLPAFELGELRLGSTTASAQVRLATDASADVVIAIEDLRAPGGLGAASVESRLRAKGSVEARNLGEGSLTVALSGLSHEAGGTLEKLAVNATASGPLRNPASLTAAVQASVSRAAQPGFPVVDIVQLDAALAGGELDLREVTVRSAGAELNASGKVKAPSDPAAIDGWLATPWDARIDVSAPALELLMPVDFQPKLTGDLQLHATGRGAGAGVGEAGARISTGGIRHPAARVPPLELGIEVTAGSAGLHMERIDLGANNQLEFRASMERSGEMAVTADAAFHLRDHKALLEALALSLELPDQPDEARFSLNLRAGATLAGLQGGEFQSVKGTITAGAESLRLPVPELPEDRPGAAAVPGELQKFDLAASVSDGSAVLEKLAFTANPWSIDLAGEVSPVSVHIKSVQVLHLKQPVLSGSARVPLDWLADEPPAPGELLVDLSTEDLQLDEFAALLGVAGLPSCRLQARVNASGTLLEPVAEVSLAATGINLPHLPDSFGPARARLSFQLQDRQASLLVEAAQPPLQPLKLAATAPLDPHEVIRSPGKLLSTPIEAELKLPESDLSALRDFAPDLIQSLPARASIEARATGTLNEPRLDAVVELSAEEILFQNPDSPTVRDLSVRLRGDGQTITVERAGLVLAGGRIDVSGDVRLEPVTDPGLDLRLVADEALVFRNANSSLRADADIRCQGPLTAARVSGVVEAVRGRMFKEIDLTPALRLPTSAPPPPQRTDRSETRLHLPPLLSDWTFDVNVRTRDPFVISGNLVNGAVSADAFLRGTGAEPLLSGGGAVDRLTLRLPFSTIRVTDGKLTLDPDHPFDPRLNVRAESRMSSHQVTIFASGPISDIKPRFTSTPPMPEPDIATLLATGTTLEGDGAQVAAEAILRGAYLYVSELYRKTFNKTKVVSDDPPRLHVGFAPVGIGADRAVDAMQATYDVSDRWRLTGQFSPDGRVRAAIGWLIHFGKKPDPAASIPSAAPEPASTP
jgi:hypothetical protein